MLALDLLFPLSLWRGAGGQRLLLYCSVECSLEVYCPRDPERKKKESQGASLEKEKALTPYHEVKDRDLF